MKIDDIIRKCIEIPGISIQRSDFSTELLLKEKEGKGSMTFFPLFPGVTIAYIFVNSPTWTAPNFREDSSIEKGPLLLNYCVTGRCEIMILSILVDTFISKISFPMQPGPEIGSISDA